MSRVLPPYAAPRSGDSARDDKLPTELARRIELIVATGRGSRDRGV